jgi:cell wall-associated NlpC family hydrolase
MTDAEQRVAVIAEAMTWLRTPFHHEGRIKGTRGGVDCAMFVAEVFERTGIVPRFPIAHYPRDWHLHRTDERFLGYIRQWAREVEVPEPADIVAYHIGHCFAHAAIITARGWPHVIHSDMEARCVTLADGTVGRHALEGSGKSRPRSFWRLKVWQ